MIGQPDLVALDDEHSLALEGCPAGRRTLSRRSRRRGPAAPRATSRTGADWRGETARARPPRAHGAARCSPGEGASRDRRPEAGPRAGGRRAWRGVGRVRRPRARTVPRSARRPHPPGAHVRPPPPRRSPSRAGRDARPALAPSAGPRGVDIEECPAANRHDRRVRAHDEPISRHGHHGLLQPQPGQRALAGRQFGAIQQEDARHDLCRPGVKADAVSRLEGPRGVAQQLQGPIDESRDHQRAGQPEDVPAVDGRAFQRLEVHRRPLAGDRAIDRAAMHLQSPDLGLAPSGNTSTDRRPAAARRSACRSPLSRIPGW